VQHWGNRRLLRSRETCARERILKDQHARDCDRRAPGTSNGLAKALSKRLNKLERRNALASWGTLPRRPVRIIPGRYSDGASGASLGLLIARLAGAGLGAKGFLGFFGRSAEIDNGEAVFAFGLGWLPGVAGVSFAVRAVDGGIVPVVACGGATAPADVCRKSAFDRATATERPL
jgi:hypothetical protein